MIQEKGYYDLNPLTCRELGGCSWQIIAGDRPVSRCRRCGRKRELLGHNWQGRLLWQEITDTDEIVEQLFKRRVKHEQAHN